MALLTPKVSSLLAAPAHRHSYTSDSSRIAFTPCSSNIRSNSVSTSLSNRCTSEPQMLLPPWFPSRAEKSSHIVCSTPAAAENPMEALNPEQQTMWQASISAMTDTVEGLSPEEAQDKLEQAFGWGPRANKFWRGRKVKEAPQEGQVANALAYLTSIGLTGPELAKVIKVFPEALACSVDGQLKESVKKLEGDWKLKGPVMVKAVARQPQVLGYDYDCQGSCEGECNRCWARF